METERSNLTVQLWDSEGRGQSGLLKRSRMSELACSDRDMTVLPRHQTPPQQKHPLMLFLPMILLTMCVWVQDWVPGVWNSVEERPLPVVLGVVIQFFLMPFCGFLLTQILALPEAQALGFIVTCTCPGGGGGYLFALLLEGDVTLPFWWPVRPTFLALATMPTNSYIYSRILGLSGTLHIPISKIMSTLLFILSHRCQWE